MRLKSSVVFLLLLLALSFCHAEKGYWVTEEELTKLEQSLMTAQNELSQSKQELIKLKEMLQAQEKQLKELSISSGSQMTQLKKASELLIVYENERQTMIWALAASSIFALSFGLYILLPK